MNLKSLPMGASALLFALSAAFPAAALAAARKDAYPPPGLYRVDSTGSMERHRGALPSIMQHLAQDGVSGNTDMSGGRAGAAQAALNAAGQGPANYCMPALPANGSMPAARGCKAGAPVPSAAGLSYATQCGGLRLNTTIRKLDGKTWEYRVVSIETGAAMAGQPDYAAARSVLAEQARNGASAAERSQAAALLAQMGGYESEMKNKSAELEQARAELAGSGTLAPGVGKVAKKRTSILRLTRVGDCKG
jgi:hypothetical protein